MGLYMGAFTPAIFSTIGWTQKFKNGLCTLFLQLRGLKSSCNTVADPGFPRGGGANSPGGAPTYEIAKFSEKLHEIERIWTPGGGRVSRAPLRSANAIVHA